MKYPLPLVLLVSKAHLILLVCLPLVLTQEAAAQILPQQSSLSLSRSAAVESTPSDKEWLRREENADNGRTTSGRVSDRCDLISSLVPCFTDLLHDQAGIWTSPFRLRPHSAFFLLPLAAAITVSSHYDAAVMKKLGPSQERDRISSDITRVASGYVLIGASGLTYGIGKLTHNERARETGVLAMETLADAGLVAQGLKILTNRQRPGRGTGTGRWWPDDSEIYTVSGSFPSGHATASWALARLITQETPGHFWLHAGLYALAGAVSVGRVTGHDHFPSDVIAGSAIGYLIGGYVYRQHSQFYERRAAGLSIIPIYEPTTRVYGIGISLHPDALQHRFGGGLRDGTKNTSARTMQ